jgi:Tol biopolymer transport system component
VTACAITAAAGLGHELETPLFERAQFLATQSISAEAISSLRAASLSADGRMIAFDSWGHGETSHHMAVYVLDRSRGGVTPEIINPAAAQPDRDRRSPSLSSDGKVIAFEALSNSSNAARFGRPEVVVLTRGSGMVRSPRGTRGEEPDGDSREPVIAGNGLVLVFTSNAQNMVSGSDANQQDADVFQWRLDDSTVTRISVDSHGAQPDVGASYSPSTSHDGHWLAFVSTARLAPDDTNTVADVYLRDTNRGITSLVSKGMGGRPAGGPSYSPVVSADGRYVAFVSNAGNLVPSDRNEEPDIYLYEVPLGAITLVSVTSAGAAANAASRRPAISGDGRYIAYESVASNLGSGPRCARAISDTNLLPDVYLLDRATHCVSRVSGSAYREWWTPSVAPGIDASGTLVVFSSTQPPNANDLSTDFDLFLSVRRR